MHPSPDLPVPQILVAMLGYNHNTFPTPLQTLVLVESVTSVEQAMKVLELITRHLANRADMDANDCEPRIAHSPRPHQTPILTPPLVLHLSGHHRKQYYMRLCEITTKMGRPEAVLALFGNLQRFQVRGPGPGHSCLIRTAALMSSCSDVPSLPAGLNLLRQGGRRGAGAAGGTPRRAAAHRRAVQDAARPRRQGRARCVCRGG